MGQWRKEDEDDDNDGKNGKVNEKEKSLLIRCCINCEKKKTFFYADFKSKDGLHRLLLIIVPKK